MKPYQEFLSYLMGEVANGSIYVLGGQGQQGSAITDNWIATREHGDEKNIARDKALRDRNRSLGYGSTMRAFDCSGLGMYWLQNVRKIFSSDMTANGMKGKCVMVSQADIKPGDWCFKVSSGRATHIAFYIGDGMVIEARGRDYGVVVSHMSDRFNAFGRLSIWKEDIEQSEPSDIERDMTNIYNISKKYIGGDIK